MTIINKSSAYLVLENTKFHIFRISLHAYNFVIEGRVARNTLFVNMVRADAICMDIACAVLTTGPKNIFCTRFTPCCFSIVANEPIMFHPEYDRMALPVAFPTRKHTDLHSIKCKRQYVLYDIRTKIAMRKINTEYNIKLSPDM